jgi:hypothetical protein
VSQDGSSLFWALGTALAVIEGQTGEEATKLEGAGGGALSAAKAGNTATRASRARIVTNVFIPSTSWLFWLAKEPSHLNKKV